MELLAARHFSRASMCIPSLNTAESEYQPFPNEESELKVTKLLSNEARSPASFGDDDDFSCGHGMLKCWSGPESTD